MQPTKQAKLASAIFMLLFAASLLATLMNIAFLVPLAAFSILGYFATAQVLSSLEKGELPNEEN